MKTVRILHTSDTHGYITSNSFLSKTDETFGLDRIHSLIKKIRTKNSILIDTGDTIQGSPLTHFYKENMSSFSNPVSDVLNHMKYDYFIPGNHDFNYGKEYLKDFTNNLQAKVLCANLYEKNQLYFEQGYDIVKLDGINVLIIGLTNNYVPNWEQPKNIENLQFINAFESLKDTIKTVKSNHQIDLTIVAYHGGFEKDLDTFEVQKGNVDENLGMKFIEELDGIDILLTGHQHRILSQKVKSVSIVQPGFNASYLSVVDITFEEGKKEITTRLIPSKDAVIDEEVRRLVKNQYDACDAYLDQVIGKNVGPSLKIKDPLSARLHKHNVVQFINDVQLRYSNADISGASLGNVVTGFDDIITYRDVLNTYIYPNTLVVLEISGKSLKEYLQKNAEFFTLKNGEIVINDSFTTPKLELYNYDMFDGINYNINVSDNVTVSNITLNGKEVEDNQVLSLVINSYRYSGGDKTGIIRACKCIKEISLDIRELLIEYIVERKEINIMNKHNINVIKKK